MTSRLAAVPAERMHLWLMLVLTFTTGINDAVGYLGLDKVFTGNMTGNVVILGMALVGAEGLPVLGPALALLGFMAGAAVGGRSLKWTQAAWTRVTTALFAVVAGLMFALAAVLYLVEDPEGPVMVTVTTLAALGMGIQAAAARHVAVKDVTTVVVTSTITGFAADSFFGNGKRAGNLRRFLAIALILLGAALGAALLELHLGAGLLVAGVVIAAATALGEWHRRIATG